MPQPSRFIQLTTFGREAELVALDERGGLWKFKRDLDGKGNWLEWFESWDVPRVKPERVGRRVEG